MSTEKNDDDLFIMSSNKHAEGSRMDKQKEEKYVRNKIKTQVVHLPNWSIMIR